MIPFDLDDDADDDPDEDDDFDKDDEDRDEDDEDDEDEDSEDDDIETWQVILAGAKIPLNVSLRLTSGIKLPRLARNFQLS